MLTLHASCVSIAGAGVLLRGPSGAGKSDLALRLIEAGAGLVADDQTRLLREGKRLIASAPPALHGLLEVRGIGPVPVPAITTAPVMLLVDLVPREDVPRLPEPRFESFLDIALPCLALHAFDHSAVAKLRIALERAAIGRLFEPEAIRVPENPVTTLLKRKV
ncbi:MAG: HPr kinase/phosphatase C-terminal domain-containing protein [Ferrovibrio sp.]